MDLFLSLFLILSLLCATTDFLTYKIPNELVLGIFVLFFIAMFVTHGVSFDVIKRPVIIFASLLAIGYAMYVFKLMGAGDVKLISVTALWMSAYSNTLLFLVVMAIAGAVIGLIYMKFHNHIEILRVSWLAKMPQSSWLNRMVSVNKTEPDVSVEKSAKKTDEKEVVKIPYALAIFIGVVISLKFV